MLLLLELVPIFVLIIILEQTQKVLNFAENMMQIQIVNYAIEVSDS